jgi:hypothetical protein
MPSLCRPAKTASDAPNQVEATFLNFFRAFPVVRNPLCEENGRNACFALALYEQKSWSGIFGPWLKKGAAGPHHVIRRNHEIPGTFPRHFGRACPDFGADEPERGHIIIRHDRRPPLAANAAAYGAASGCRGDRT